MSEIYIIFDGPPSHESGRFVEVEDGNGNGLGTEQTGADWSQRKDGLWQLGPFSAERKAKRKASRTVRHSPNNPCRCSGPSWKPHDEDCLWEKAEVPA